MFAAAAEAVEESILNAVVTAQTMTGWQGYTAYGLPNDELARIMAEYRTGGERRYRRGPVHQ